MKLALIATYTHPVALGMRYVSSYLKSAGHEVEMIFMASRRDTARPNFAPAVIESLIEHCRGVDLIGMGLLTNAFCRARFLADALRGAGVKAPIIWGGTHATVAPDECLECADIVCVGEGERAMLQLADRMDRGQDPTTIGGLAFRAGGPFGNRHEVRNPVEPLIENLDDLPFPDYDLGTHWVADDGHLVPARPENLRGALDRLRVETTRGCPYRCTFCNNTTWANIYRGKGSWVRRRSIENVLCELEEMCRRFACISAVNIVDDLFFVRPVEEIAAFADGYTRRIGRPLEVDVHPELVTEDKIAVLSRMPIALVSMGIQSGSPDTLCNIYHRRTPVDRIAVAGSLFRRLGNQPVRPALPGSQDLHVDADGCLLSMPEVVQNSALPADCSVVGSVAPMVGAEKTCVEARSCYAKARFRGTSRCGEPRFAAKRLQSEVSRRGEEDRTTAAGHGIQPGRLVAGIPFVRRLSPTRRVPLAACPPVHATDPPETGPGGLRQPRKMF